MADALQVPVAVASLPRDGKERRFEAAAEAREALAREFDLVSVERFSAVYVARPWRGDGVRIEGRFAAEIVQESVVTLEPVRQSLGEAFDYTFAPEASRLAMRSLPATGEIEIDPEADDPPETFVGVTIEFGPYLSEAFALALDPYPRENGKAFGDYDTDPDPTPEKTSAFDVLARLVPRGEREE